MSYNLFTGLSCCDSTLRESPQCRQKKLNFGTILLLVLDFIIVFALFWEMFPDILLDQPANLSPAVDYLETPTQVAPNNGFIWEVLGFALTTLGKKVFC